MSDLDKMKDEMKSAMKKIVDRLNRRLDRSEHGASIEGLKDDLFYTYVDAMYAFNAGDLSDHCAKNLASAAPKLLEIVEEILQWADNGGYLSQMGGLENDAAQVVREAKDKSHDKIQD